MVCRPRTRPLPRRRPERGRRPLPHRPPPPRRHRPRRRHPRLHPRPAQRPLHRPPRRGLPRIHRHPRRRTGPRQPCRSTSKTMGRGRHSHSPGHGVMKSRKVEVLTDIAIAYLNRSSAQGDMKQPHPGVPHRITPLGAGAVCGCDHRITSLAIRTPHPPQSLRDAVWHPAWFRAPSVSDGREGEAPTPRTRRLRSGLWKLHCRTPSDSTGDGVNLAAAARLPRRRAGRAAVRRLRKRVHSPPL